MIEFELRHFSNQRWISKHRIGSDRGGQIPDTASIYARPSEVDDRVMPGHQEGEFIKGANNAPSVGVLIGPLSTGGGVEIHRCMAERRFHLQF